MTVDVLRTKHLYAAMEGTRDFWRALKAYKNERPSASAFRHLLTPEQFQEELAVLRLSGKRYTPEEYSEALASYLGISIIIHVIPDACYPELSRRLALSGRLGELRYAEELGLAAIFVPGSLPPLVLALTVLHELGHLAAGDLLIRSEDDRDDVSGEHDEDEVFATSRIRHGNKLATLLPLADEEAREQEANLRASYALLSGCLGGDSPYAYGMNDVL